MKNDKMMNVICDEIDKIAEKGLTTSNLETAYKLIDMYKDLVTVDAMEEGGYSETMSYDGDYRGGSMRGRGRNAKRDAMGRYSNDGRYMDGRSYADERYSQAKMDYRYSKTGGSKQEVMESLKEKMTELKEELQGMSRDSDFPEERQMIDKYVEMLDRAMR